MLKANKLCIAVYRNGRRIGYVKSMAYKKNTYQVTENRDEAKGYANQERAFGDIDALVTMDIIQHNCAISAFSVE